MRNGVARIGQLLENAVMNRPTCLISLACVIAILTGCATAPTGPTGQLQTLADAGPAPADPQKVIAEVLRTRLKDPDSARVQLTKPPRAVVFAKTAATNGGAGWELCPEVNARNGYGAYTGYKRMFILWRNGHVVDFIDGHLGEAYCNERNDYRLQSGR